MVTDFSITGVSSARSEEGNVTNIARPQPSA
jgi:hypothetical protein